MNAARKSHRPERPRPEESAESARLPEEAREAHPGRNGAEAPPHALWDRLDEWVSGGARDKHPVRKLPVAARLAIILLLSVACWLVVIALIALL